MTEVIIESFRNFYGQFGYHIDEAITGEELSFFVRHNQVEMIYNFEVHQLIVINSVTRRLKGVSFDITFTEGGKSILLFEIL